MKKIFKLAEFFSGPGGMAYGAGLSKAIDKKKNTFTIEHAWASDYDQDSCRTYEQNIKTKAIFCENVQNFFSLVDKKKIVLPKFNCFAYGFPCNDFSNVGESLGLKGKYGPLYSYGVELVNRYEPDWFVAENVGGIKSSNEGKTFQKILEDLSGAGKGYELTTHKYKFEDYGIPQARHRIIIVGIKKKFNLKFKVPKPSYKIMTSKTSINAKNRVEKPACSSNFSKSYVMLVSCIEHSED